MISTLSAKVADPRNCSTTVALLKGSATITACPAEAGSVPLPVSVSTAALCGTASLGIRTVTVWVAAMRRALIRSLGT